MQHHAAPPGGCASTDRCQQWRRLDCGLFYLWTTCNEGITAYNSIQHSSHATLITCNESVTAHNSPLQDCYSKHLLTAQEKLHTTRTTGGLHCGGPLCHKTGTDLGAKHLCSAGTWITAHTRALSACMELHDWPPQTLEGNETTPVHATQIITLLF